MPTRRTTTSRHIPRGICERDKRDRPRDIRGMSHIIKEDVSYLSPALLCRLFDLAPLLREAIGSGLQCHISMQSHCYLCLCHHADVGRGGDCVMLPAERPDPYFSSLDEFFLHPIGILVAYIRCFKVGKLNYLSCFVALAPDQQQLG
ncbi:hypothetical protein EYF80_062642 [Liparis tanakae]|uniref:Uncharacterized protein n=1 Tax=Liparis tanakae TaxID=230148 RepID=A0A4Z2EEM2_9TELE|nr:hypothetical protein EYF80_062642 [Liparis tanakae]